MQDVTIFIQHHLTTSLLFAALVVLVFFVELLRSKRKASNLSPAQLTQLINHQQAVVVDLRPAEQFAKGHIIESLSIPLADFKEKGKKLEKMKNRPLILVCAKGFESHKIATSLKNQGYQVHVLGGGIGTWVSENFPVVKG